MSDTSRPPPTRQPSAPPEGVPVGPADQARGTAQTYELFQQKQQKQQQQSPSPSPHHPASAAEALAAGEAVRRGLVDIQAAAAAAGDQQQQQQGGGGGGRATVTAAAQTIRRDEWWELHRIPCARDGLMAGIGGGAVTGAVRFIARSSIATAVQWSFGGFLIGAIAKWEYCRAQRRQEKAAMALLIETRERKQLEKKREMEEKAAEAARRRKEEEDKARRWYKFW
ncbi:hypothetical protein GGR56DRAFT_645224 [Xylariaceae sp. FL0804]|nr:hypothetical protein GGR56DRAFT_645224 [Xylariaceae sp. FL0804]